MYALCVRLTFIVPAFNEERSVGDVLSAVPRVLDGIQEIELLVIDDGSTDGTATAAREAGAQVVSHAKRLGLAASFRTGATRALRDGAGLLCTLDADGQYDPREIVLLLKTLHERQADLVIGDRQIWRCAHMPFGNRLGNSIGSFMLRVLGTTGVRDASSGFRLLTRDAAHRIHITSEHTYTHEMLIQASVAGLVIAETPVTFLPRTHGKSKLVRTLRHHILRSCGTILRSLFLYRPLRKFLFLATACVACSFGLLVLALVSEMRIDMLVAAGGMLILGVQFVLIGILADVYAAGRRVLLEHPHDLLS